MRISDWSSDVCSSDLVRAQCADRLGRGIAGRRRRIISDVGAKRRGADRLRILQRLPALGRVEDQLDVAVLDPVDDLRTALGNLVDALDRDPLARQIIDRKSNTSELQSLMRISY